MKRANADKGTSSRQWKRMLLTVALKTEVIDRCRRRSDVEWLASHASERMKLVKP